MSSDSFEAEIEKLESELHALLLSTTRPEDRAARDEEIRVLDSKITELKAAMASITQNERNQSGVEEIRIVRQLHLEGGDTYDMCVDSNRLVFLKSGVSGAGSAAFTAGAIGVILDEAVKAIRNKSIQNKVEQEKSLDEKLGVSKDNFQVAFDDIYRIPMSTTWLRGLTVKFMLVRKTILWPSYRNHRRNGGVEDICFVRLSSEQEEQLSSALRNTPLWGRLEPSVS